MSGIHDTFSGSMPELNTLYIRMTRGRRRIADELHKAFGGFGRIIIDVDGEQHEFSVDSFIRLLEEYEGACDKNRWHELFGTPERVADFAIKNCRWDCYVCPFDGNLCDNGRSPNSKERGAMLEWLRGESDGE